VYTLSLLFTNTLSGREIITLSLESATKTNSYRVFLVTVFGINAGSIMKAILYLNNSLEKLARVVVRYISASRRCESPLIFRRYSSPDRRPHRSFTLSLVER